MSRPRIAVITRHGLNAADWGHRHARHEVIDRTPYAYHLAEDEAVLEWSQDGHEGVVGRWWRMTLRHLLGFDLVHVWRNRALLARADAIWTHTEREHLAVAMLKSLRPRTYRAHSIAQSVWLWDLWPHMAGIRRWFIARLLRQHTIELLLSRVNRDDSLSAVPGRAVVRVPFGTHFARPVTAASPRAPRVLVVGNDRHRDWPLMAQVARAIPEVDFDVVSLAEEARAIAWPPNVTVRSASQTELLEEIYRTATVVAVPLRENRHASGCTVAIEGLSAGVPVVATDTGGIDEYVAGSTAALVPVGDVAAFTARVREYAHRTDAVDATVPARHGLSERDYVARLVRITQSVLNGEAIPESALAFERMPMLFADTADELS